MTSYFPDSEAIEKEQKNKKAKGYFQLKNGWVSLVATTDIPERIASIKAEALAAQLIWEQDSLVASVKDQGISEAGKKFFVLSDNYSSMGPWHDFYIRPGMLQELINYLDNNSDAMKARDACK